MAFTNIFENYKDEIELIQAQNCVECELYSVIASIIRSREYSNLISLRDVTSRRCSKLSNRFESNKGFPDFVILTREKTENAKILGAIEVKRVLANMNHEKNMEQVLAHIEKFKNVIYTNGIVWKFYNVENSIDIPVWIFSLGKIKRGGKIEWNTDNTQWESLLKNLDNINWTISD